MGSSPVRGLLSRREAMRDDVMSHPLPTSAGSRPLPETRQGGSSSSLHDCCQCFTLSVMSRHE
jgi:hypothetical protein